MSIKYKNIKELKKIELTAVVEIFFENTDVTFSSEIDKANFQKKYLDFYIENSPEFFIVCFFKDKVCGYICGDIHVETLDKLTYFHKYLKLFKASFNKFPAHLHINISKNVQGLGIGSEMINYFCNLITIVEPNLNGVHIITSEDSRNVNFYERNEFKLILKKKFLNSNLVLLGRSFIN